MRAECRVRIPGVGSDTETEPAPLCDDNRELARFAAGALDWPAVRELIRPLALSAIGARYVAELVPLADEQARGALARAEELQRLRAADGTAAARAEPEASRSDEPPLAGVPDPVPLLRDAARYGRSLSGEDLVDVARLLRVTEDVAHWLAARRGSLVATNHLWADPPEVGALRQRLEDALDRRGKVVDDASPRLARLRLAMADVERELDALMRELAGRQNLRAAFAEGHAGQVHRRSGRRVLAVRERQAGRIPGIVHDRSQSGQTVFVEPRGAVELGNRLAGLEADAAREVARILTELTQAVLAKRGDIESCAERVGRLELGVISARFAARYDGRVARVAGDPGNATGLVLRGFRHPLLAEQVRQETLECVVPIDVRLGADFDMLVVTGPNTGGKTLALKSAGLASLLTRLGFALPCNDGTTVPLFDGIVADIGDEQEIEQNLSTFASHLVRIKAGLERATERTLVLLDELGGGTDPVEGAALGEAILEHLLERRIPTLASTHLGQLKAFGFRFERAENAHVEFDVESLAPRYTVVIGAPGESRALAIAGRLGLPASIIERADARVERGDSEAATIMQSMRDVRVDAERLRNEAGERLVDLEREIEVAEEERAKIGAKTARLEAEAQLGLEERLRRSREWIERVRRLLPQVEQRAREELAVALTGLEDALGDAALTDRRQAFLDGLKKGSLVWLPTFKKRASVTRIYRDKRELKVRLGKHELSIAFDDVTFYENL